MSELAHNWVRLSPNGRKSGTFKIIIGNNMIVVTFFFKDQFSVHFGSVSQNVLKTELKKSQICPTWGEFDPNFGLSLISLRLAHDNMHRLVYVLL